MFSEVPRSRIKSVSRVKILDYTHEIPVCNLAMISFDCTENDNAERGSAILIK